MCDAAPVSSEDDFRIRPGRIRSTRAQRARPFIAQALAAAQRAGGTVSRKGTIGPGHRSRFGSGQSLLCRSEPQPAATHAAAARVTILVRFEATGRCYPSAERNLR